MNFLLKLRNLKWRFTIPETFVQIPLTTIATGLLIVYAVREAYWYQKVGLGFVKWHVHLAPYAFIWLAGYYIFNALYKERWSERINNFFLLFSSIVVSLFLVELALEISGKTKTSFEEIVGYYHSSSVPLVKGPYYVWTSPKEHWIKKPEYTYWRPTNSLGLPDVEWPVKKLPNEKRILALGDSFTEGDGAPDDSDYVALLAKRLSEKSSNFYLMNGGVLGSDPFFNFVQLKNQLLVYKPDYILQTLSSYDIKGDLYIRGGMERFQKNGTLKFNDPPWWEPLYAVSNICRCIVSKIGYNDEMFKKNLSTAETARFNQQTTELFKEYKEFCRLNGIKLFVLLRPDKIEIEGNNFEYDFTPIVNESGVEAVNLLPYYKSYMQKSNTKPEEYFWKHDLHYNAKGYQMMADVVYESIGSALIDSLPIVSAKN